MQIHNPQIRSSLEVHKLIPLYLYAVDEQVRMFAKADDKIHVLKSETKVTVIPYTINKLCYDTWFQPKGGEGYSAV